MLLHCHVSALLLLLTLDSTLRRSGGGEIGRVGEAFRFISPGAILSACLIGDVATVSSNDCGLMLD